MSKIAKLKKQALEFEQKKQFDKALARYTLALQEMEEAPDEADVALYNRVGDLLLRQGSVAEAVDHYEKAVDLYADSGLFNNAIALCNKILRNAPGRSSVYYKLGKISAQKGFTGDARQNYLEYAGRMERAGQRGEAFRALKEFVELCPDQEDIRKLVEDQLAHADGSVEATTQRKAAEQKEQAEAKASDARAAAERAKAAELEADQRRAAGLPTPKSSELVFLDLDDIPASGPRRGAPGGGAPAHGAPSTRPPAPPDDGPSVDLPFIDAGEDAPPAAASAPPAPAAAAIVPDVSPSRPSSPADADPLTMPDLMGPADSFGASGASPAGGAARPAEPGVPAGPGAWSASGGYDTVAGSVGEQVPGLQRGPYDEYSASAQQPAPAPPAGAAGLGVAGLDPGDAAVSPHVGLPLVELPHAELPQLDMPQLEVPQLEVPQLEVPQLEVPRLDTPRSVAPHVEAPGRAAAAPEAPALDLPMPEPAAPVAAAPIVPASEAEPAPRIDADLQSMQDLATPVTETHEAELPFILSDSFPAAQAADAPVLPDAPARPEAPPVAASPVTFADDEPLVIIRESERDGGLGWDDLTARADAELGDLSGMSADLVAPPPPAPSPTNPLKRRIEGVRARLEADPRSGDLRRELGELLIEDGDRASGMRELEAAMMEFERAGDPVGARSLAEEILRLEPDSVRYHQKRVEYAFRSNDKPRLVDAYLELADCLMRSGELEKSRSVYARVRELSPADSRADAALGAVGGADGAVPAPTPAFGAPFADGRTGGAATNASVAPAGAPSSVPPRDGEYIDLGAWLAEDERPRSTRMIAYGVTEPEDGKQADFEEMLERFKQGVAANIDDTDHESHYDLGIAYREMGLLDEAIAELQKALRTTNDRIRTYEALGQCFVDKGQYQVAASLLTHALADSTGSDQTLVGILYLLGVSCEALRRWGDARSYYERVFAIDLQFRDVRDRLAAAEQAAS